MPEELAENRTTRFLGCACGAAAQATEIAPPVAVGSLDGALDVEAIVPGGEREPVSMRSESLVPARLTSIVTVQSLFAHSQTT